MQPFRFQCLLLVSILIGFTWIPVCFYGSICVYRLRCSHIFIYTAAYAFIRIYIVLDMNKDVFIRTHVHLFMAQGAM